MKFIKAADGGNFLIFFKSYDSMKVSRERTHLDLLLRTSYGILRVKS